MPSPYFAVFSVVMSASLLQLSNGLFGTFLPVRMAHEGFSTPLIGLVVAGHGAGFLLGCLSAPMVISRVGHIRCYASFAAIAAAATLAYTLATDLLLWLVLRAFIGFCFAALFTVGESWLNDRTGSGARGRILSFYMVCGRLALAGGQLLFALGEVGGPASFMVASAILSLSLVPVALTRSTSPEVAKLRMLGLGSLLRLAPAALVACLAAGLMNTAVINIGPVYATELGLSSAAIATLMAAIQLGGLFFQWPLGWLSDKVDRRAVIAAATSGQALIALSIAAFGAADPVPASILFFLWGGLGPSIYAIAIAHANDHAQPHQLVPLSSSLLMCWALGSVFGPSLATAAMAWLGPAGLFYYNAILAGSLAGFMAWRISRRAPPPAEQRGAFVTIPESSPAVVDLNPRRSE